MARRRRNGRWQETVSHPDLPGPSHRKRASFATKREAQAWKARVLYELAAGIYQQRERQRAASITCGDLWPQYLEACEAGTASGGRPNSVATLEWKRQVWRSHIGPTFAKVELGCITRRDISVWLVRLSQGGLQVATRNRAAAVFRQLLTTAVEWDLIAAVPKIETAREPEPVHEWLSNEDIAELVQLSGDWGGRVLLLARTGIRRGEAAALHHDAVDLVRGQIEIVRSLSKAGGLLPPKGKKARTIPLTPQAQAALQAEPTTDGWVWPRPTHPDEPLRISAWESRAKRLAVTWGRKFGWHMLRHTFASHLVMDGRPLPAVQALMGHSNITTTMRYTHLAPNALRDAVANLDGTGAAQAQAAESTSGAKPHSIRARSDERGGDLQRVVLKEDT